MDFQQLKGMVEAGRYRPEPALVAEAMLRRRGLRELLVGADVAALKPAGRTPRLPAIRRQAA